MNFLNNPKNIPESYGLRIAAGLIGFFLIMKVLGWHHYVELRFLNLFILIIGVHYGLQKFKDTHDGSLNYFRGLDYRRRNCWVGVSYFRNFPVCLYATRR